MPRRLRERIPVKRLRFEALESRRPLTANILQLPVEQFRVADAYDLVADVIITAERADVDGDGELDWIVSHATGIDVLPSSAMNTVVSVSIAAVQEIRVGDVNHDGDIDLLVRTIDGVHLISNLRESGSLSMVTSYSWTTPQTFNEPWRFEQKRTLEFQDLNADGLLDIAYVSPAGLQVHLQSDFGFDAGISYVGGRSLLAHDVNGDLQPDLITISEDQIVVRRNDEGFFEEQSPWSPQAFPSHFIDVNADGRDDIISNRAQILLGQADGSYVGNGESYRHRGVNSIAAADVNGDGHIDVIVGEPEVYDLHDVQFGDARGGISVMIGKGDGTFSRPLPVASPDTVSVFAEDTNGDGKLEIIAAQRQPNNIPGFGMLLFPPMPSRVLVVESNAQSTFAMNATHYQVPNCDYCNGGTFFADFNGDSRLDAIVSRNHEISLFYGRADGTFDEQESIYSSTRNEIRQLHVSDLQADGISDVVYAYDEPLADNQSNPHVVTLLGSETGLQQVNDSMFAGPLWLRDVDGDNKTEIYVSKFETVDGTLVLERTFDYSIESSKWQQTDRKDFPVIDLNRDGLPDTTQALGQPDGSNNQFWDPAASFDGILVDLQLADVDGNGIIDVIATGSGAYDPDPFADPHHRPVSLSIMYLQQNGLLREDRLEIPHPTILNTGDFNDDGVADLIIGQDTDPLSNFQQTPRLIHLFADNSATPTQTIDMSVFGADVLDIRSVDLVDMTQDGATDLVLSVSKTISGELAMHLIVVPQRGGQFSVENADVVSIPQLGMHFFADINDDGATDVVWKSDGFGTLLTLAQPTITGDFNHDRLIGAADLETLRQNIQQQPVEMAPFDLNDDELLNQDDVEYWIEEIAKTRRGDVNFDGTVNFADFLVLSANFGKQETTWAEGDFDGNQRVDFADFLALSAHFGFKQT